MSVNPLPDETGSDAPGVSPVTAAPAAMPPDAAALLLRLVRGLIALVALVALALVVVLWQKVGGMQEQLARQSAEAQTRSTEARMLAQQAQETVRDAAARLALMETRVGEVSLQRTQLEELIHSLSRSRDDNLVIDIESSLRLALQQAQVTGDLEPLLAALKSADQRIERSAQPRLAPLQRAIQRDADRLRTSASANSGVTLQKIDQLLRAVDDLPTQNAVGLGGNTSAWPMESLAADAPWWQRALWVLRQETRSLLRVGRIDRPEAALLAPDQTVYLRENLKLKLLSARLALLSRDVDTARAELGQVSTTLYKYFDPASRRTQAAATVLQQLQAQVKATPPLRIDDTLAALATAAAGR